MRLNEVINRFALVSGLEPCEVSKWTPVCIDAMNEIKRRLRAGVPSCEEDILRLSACAGVLAYYRYRLYMSGSQAKSFTAGSVSVTMAEFDTEKAKELWEFEYKSVEDLLEPEEDFCFRGVKA